MDTGLGGDRVARMLAAEGVGVVFGIIDGSYFGLYSRLGAHDIRLITPRHETTAVHMAGAYARLTGRLGVCIASNGPGVANALPGVAVEQGEGNRVLLLTSWRRAPIVGPDRGGTYQYFDQVAVTQPMTKWSGAATSIDRVPEMLRRARNRLKSRLPSHVAADLCRLPFADESFDLVVCQFGIMFLPDKLQGYKEALRVLRKGGTFLFNVWDRIEANELAAIVSATLAKMFPENPPTFMAKTPHGYNDIEGIKATLAAAGFANVSAEIVPKRSRAPSALPPSPSSPLISPGSPLHPYSQP